jgi:hypothetical protein
MTTLRTHFDSSREAAETPPLELSQCPGVPEAVIGRTEIPQRSRLLPH